MHASGVRFQTAVYTVYTVYTLIPLTPRWQESFLCLFSKASFLLLDSKNYFVEESMIIINPNKNLLRVIPMEVRKDALGSSE